MENTQEKLRKRNSQTREKERGKSEEKRRRDGWVSQSSCESAAQLGRNKELRNI